MPTTADIVKTEAYGYKYPPWADRKNGQQKIPQSLRQRKSRSVRMRERITIEGKFGQGKRRFGLSRIMAKLKVTSETMIMLPFIVMNLEKMLTKALYFCLRSCSILRCLLAKSFVAYKSLLTRSSLQKWVWMNEY
ncbi:MAG: transposase [Nitrospirae bacterium]|nr:transposase [Candidatus Manganitrophaceae bacterium]